ncbi:MULTISPECIES: formate/nitrite transporter family protein [Clostridium]|uniref:Formate/nitrite transporter family protein n=1 Tax=Clostridium aquiflavi TaxID=3073603 RepID=A0ABU1EFL3_9CLOT|nr:formate/nitrite transporter family protein [Clostridium sp. 5N-1]MDR5587185.1 formate/nitrite transporter family protein [Clostridium sp. 5N-1]NFG61948.1 formate/nitrite transporter family protein [Clostridium botulinum]NFQ08384.1 formate/nitrite transporter family protein [Clostridium botulinum]
MFCEEFNSVVVAAKAKVNLLKNNKLGYFISSMLAGAYVGMGIILIFTIGGLLSSAGSPFTKVIMGASFGVALSLVVMAGSELFTGNNFVMTAGSLSGEVTWSDTLKVWGLCFLGNLVGSIITGAMFYLTGLATGPVGEFIASTSAVKMSVPFLPLLMRGVLCNILVCLAVWCSFRCKNEVAKLIMIFWCLFVFITAGFEHSVANMTLLTVGLLSPGAAYVSVMGYLYNIIVVTLGNIIGGAIFLAVPYYLISKKK